MAQELGFEFVKLYPAFSDALIDVLVCVIDEIEVFAYVFDVLVGG